MKRLLALLTVALAVPVPAAAASERSVPGDLLVYSGPSSSCTVENVRSLIVADADGSAADVLHDCVDQVGPPSPDGERIAVTSFTNTTGPARITQARTGYATTDGACFAGGRPGDDLDWSPDGLRVVAAMYRSYGDQFGLHVSAPELGDGTARWLVRGAGIRWPTWHPTNGTVAFTVERFGNHDIDVIRLDGTGRTTLLGGASDDTVPTFSPDGRLLAFARGGRPFLAAADGSGARRVADVAIRGTLSWAPDGRRLVVALTDGIATIDVADGGVTRLTTGDHTAPTLFRRRSVAGSDGYALVGADGLTRRFGASCAGLNARLVPTRTFVAVAASPDRQRGWYVSADGVVETGGDAALHDDAPPGHRYVGIAATPSGGGYWVVAADGFVAARGDARPFGSMSGRRLNHPIVGMAGTPSVRGYWVVASDGGVFAFGDARFLGSTGARRLNRDVVGMAPTPSGAGYWLYAGDGGIFTFGDARFLGSTGGRRLNAPVFAMAATTDGNGYWLFARDGGVFTFGSARFHGSAGGSRLPAPIVGAFDRGTMVSSG